MCLEKDETCDQQINFNKVCLPFFNIHSVFKLLKTASTNSRLPYCDWDNKYVISDMHILC